MRDGNGSEVLAIVAGAVDNKQAVAYEDALSEVVYMSEVSENMESSKSNK